MPCHSLHARSLSNSTRLLLRIRSAWTDYVGENTASGMHSRTFGVIDREVNSSYDRTQKLEVRVRSISAPAFAVFDARGSAGVEGGYRLQAGLLTRLIVLLTAVCEPPWEGARMHI